MKLVEVKHPLVKHKLGVMREADIDTKKFRELATEVGSLLTYEATADLETEKVIIEGWNGPVEIERIKGKKVTVVPILRAGLGMMDGVLEHVPSARISVVGIYRNEETLEPVPYFQKLASDLEERLAIVVDPMLATGGSMISTIDLLKAKGCQHIKVLVLVAAPEGIKALEKAHPDIFNVLLQVLDDGQLTDSKGRKVDFSNMIIIMTSNLGATSLWDDKTVGFGARDIRLDHANMEKRMLEELKKAYRPEFINRIDEKVVFHSLSAEDMQEVVKVMVKPLIASLADKGIELKFQASALKLLAQEGYDVEMGARPLRRTLQTQVEDKLSELLLTGDLTTGQILKVGVKAGQLKFEVA